MARKKTKIKFNLPLLVIGTTLYTLTLFILGLLQFNQGTFILGGIITAFGIAFFSEKIVTENILETAIHGFGIGIFGFVLLITVLYLSVVIFNRTVTQTGNLIIDVFIIGIINFVIFAGASFAERWI